MGDVQVSTQERELVPLTDDVVKAFIEATPVYVEGVYKQTPLKFRWVQLYEIDGWCNNCERPKQLQFGGPRSNYESIRPFATTQPHLKYYCVSCGELCREIYLDVEVNGPEVKLQKFGEWPRQRPRANKVLEKFFGDDLEAYRKGAACLEHGYGVGAFAYFRQIVEGHIQSLLDLVQQEAIAMGQSEVLAALADLRKDTPMKQRIDLANLALPPQLKPNGLNPLGRIYAVLSEGIHAGTDRECLQKAKVVAQCLTFLVGELTERKRTREAFVQTVGSL